MKILLYSVIFIFSSSNILFAETSNDKKVAIMYSDQFLLHNTGKNHPERPERLSIVVDNLKDNNLLSPHLIWPSVREASKLEIKLVHTQNYIDLVEKEVNSLKKNSISYLSTGDTVISKESNKVARTAVGAGLRGADAIMKGEVSSAFVLSRPPGHHASASKGMGFCIYNNIAIVARYLQKKYDIKRILIVDFDVHHGNGTQDIFYNDDSVFYFDIHQHPFYPQSGRPNEIGIGKGKGFTLNIDLPRGAGDTELINAFQNKLKPAMDKFQPEFILVSAGFDSHQGDLLGQLNFTNVGYENVAIILSNIAKKYASDRELYILEGGYVAENISKSAEKIIGILTRDMGD